MAGSVISTGHTDDGFASEKVLICTSNGYRWVTFEELLNLDEPLHQNHDTCIHCLISSLDGQGFIVLASLLLLTENNHYHLADYQPPFKKLRFSFSNYISRAPPLS